MTTRIRETLFVLLILLFISCNKEYFPDEKDYRDSQLIGTWSDIADNETIIVFETSGYYDNVNYVNNEDYTGYTCLGGIWETTKKREESTNGIGEIYCRSNSSNLSHTGWKSYKDYKFSVNYDTLYLKDNSSTDFILFAKHKDQLKYDGPDFVDIDQRQTE